ncbi:hypothetical protein GOP47_0011055 [Adiantum capillus-veneris]|nr:hypothetical protein GOP47_0011055 [Adiantum capillus-veneris]
MDHARNVGIAIDFSPSSKNALLWAIQNLVRSGDSVIILIVLPKGSDVGSPHLKTLWFESGSPLIPFLEFKDPKTQNGYGVATDSQFISLLDNLNLHHDVIIHAKICWGDPKEKLCEAASNIPLQSLVMGSRGQGTLKRTILGSVSNHVVNHATCAVTVVK